MMRSLAIAMCVILSAWPRGSVAEDQAATVLRATLDPPRVVVGQPTTLVVEVLAPNYLTAPPELPGFQVRNAVTRQQAPININEQRDGMTYAGVRFAFAIYPQAPGSYALNDQTITLHYAAEPPASREATVTLPRLSFEAFVPDAAAGLDPFLSATRLTLTQAVQGSSGPLKVGDAVIRTVTIKAEGTPAMLLPPTRLPGIDGLARYPAQPVLDDTTDRRSSVLTATRSDSATYMLQRPGSYLLPAIDVSWWDAAHGELAHAHLDAVPLQVAAAPTAAGEAAPRATWRTLVDRAIDHWFLTLLALAMLALLGWVVPPLARRSVKAARQRHAAWQQSEAFFFRKLSTAARHGDARTTYAALLDWLQRFEPAAPAHTVRALQNAARDPALDREVGTIECALFAAQPVAGGWSGRRLMRHIGAARRALGRRNANHRGPSLPSGINPTGGAPPDRRRRLPAR